MTSMNQSEVDDIRRSLRQFAFVVWPFRRWVWGFSDWRFAKVVKRKELTSTEAKRDERQESVAGGLITSTIHALISVLAVLLIIAFTGGLSLWVLFTFGVGAILQLFVTLILLILWSNNCFRVYAWKRGIHIPLVPIPMPVVFVHLIPFILGALGLLARSLIGPSFISSVAMFLLFDAWVALQISTVIALDDGQRPAKDADEARSFHWGT